MSRMAPGQGFEPRFLGPKPSVLPLDDPGINYNRLIITFIIDKIKNLSYYIVIDVGCYSDFYIGEESPDTREQIAPKGLRKLKESATETKPTPHTQGKGEKGKPQLVQTKWIF